MPQVQEAKKWLNLAIQRHERHMEGQEPTSGKPGEISQRLMMEEMQYAYEELLDEKVTPSSWYLKNVKLFSAPRKEAGNMAGMKK